MPDPKNEPVSNIRQPQTGDLNPKGHKIPEGASPADPDITFEIPDCGVKEVDEFIHTWSKKRKEY